MSEETPDLIFERTEDDIVVATMNRPAARNTASFGMWEEFARMLTELEDGTPARALVLRGAGGYHVNEQYPIAIDLDVRNGSAQKTNLRRADAAEYTQERARFVVPVTAQGPGTTVRGRVRFAVCSAENCVPKSQNFAVALP